MQSVQGFFRGEKGDGREFTDEDEEVLVLFASQAAAIVNARAHRDERRARADLEALIETSPVGVVVLDPGTCRPVSVNREARRIVASLRMPGRTAEQVHEALTLRRADGRELSLGEFPLAREFVPSSPTPRRRPRCCAPICRSPSPATCGGPA